MPASRPTAFVPSHPVRNVFRTYQMASIEPRNRRLEHQDRTEIGLPSPLGAIVTAEILRSCNLRPPIVDRHSAVLLLSDPWRRAALPQRRGETAWSVLDCSRPRWRQRECLSNVTCPHNVTTMSPRKCLSSVTPQCHPGSPQRHRRAATTPSSSRVTLSSEGRALLSVRRSAASLLLRQMAGRLRQRSANAARWGTRRRRRVRRSSDTRLYGLHRLQPAPAIVERR